MTVVAGGQSMIIEVTYIDAATKHCMFAQIIYRTIYQHKGTIR